MATNSRVSGLKVVEYSGKDQIPSPLAKSKISFLVSGTCLPITPTLNQRYTSNTKLHTSNIHCTLVTYTAN